MLHAAITLPGGTDGLWTLLFVPLSIAVAALGGVAGILLLRRERPMSTEPEPTGPELTDPVPPEPGPGGEAGSVG